MNDLLVIVYFVIICNLKYIDNDIVKVRLYYFVVKILFWKWVIIFKKMFLEIFFIFMFIIMRLKL